MPILLSELTTGTAQEALTSDERNYVREVLGVSKSPVDGKYKESEKRFDEFTPYENKSMRYWMTKYEVESEDEDTTEIDTEGADISAVRTRQRIALAIFNLVFASGTITPLEDINIPKYEEKRSKISFVPMKFTEDETRQSEY